MGTRVRHRHKPVQVELSKVREEHDANLTTIQPPNKGGYMLIEQDEATDQIAIHVSRIPALMRALVECLHRNDHTATEIRTLMLNSSELQHPKTVAEFEALEPVEEDEIPF